MFSIIVLRLRLHRIIETKPFSNYSLVIKRFFYNAFCSIYIGIYGVVSNYLIFMTIILIKIIESSLFDIIFCNFQLHIIRTIKLDEMILFFTKDKSVVSFKRFSVIGIILDIIDHCLLICLITSLCAIHALLILYSRILAIILSDIFIHLTDSYFSISSLWFHILECLLYFQIV